MKSISNYADIFLSERPLIDTRAPIEFQKGSLPNAINLPLMSDDERAKVGTCYKQQGQEAAIILGHQLVCGESKTQRVNAWIDFANAHPNGLLFCFRGGLRSRISQQWLIDAGVDYPRVEGGYKALRTFLIDTIETASTQCQFTVLGGLTGTGKTEILQTLTHAIDLEHHAHHRGSSFGKHASAQPSQINFENALAVDFLKKRAKGIKHFVVENESHLIGMRAIPLCLQAQMKVAPLVLVNEPIAARIERILKDYVIDLRQEFTDMHGAEQGDILYAAQLSQSLAKISRRLGGELYQQLQQILQAALHAQLANKQLDQHRQWIALLLTQYYDPMYHYQREQNQHRVIYTGERQDVQAYLQALR